MPYEAVLTSQNLIEIGFVVYGPLKIPQGATVSVTRGGGCSGGRDETELPELVVVPHEFVAPPVELDPKRITIRTYPSDRRRAIVVSIASRSTEGFRIINNAYYLRIGRRSYRGGPSMDTRTLDFLVPSDEFWKLPDGATMYIQDSKCLPGGGVPVGPLNKSMLDR